MDDIVRFDRNDFIRHDYKKREYDGKWEKIVEIMDRENVYPKLDGDHIVYKIPTRWITVEVLDDLIKF